MLATGVSGDTLTGHLNRIRAVAFSPPDGRILASASDDCKIWLWAINPMAATGEFKDVLLDHKRRVYILTFSPDGKILASASDDMTVRLWAINPVLATGVSKDTVIGHSGPIHAVAFSPNCRMLAVASTSNMFDTTVQVWNIKPATTIVELKEELKVHKSTRILSFSEDGGYINTSMGYLPLSGYNEPVPHKDLICQVYFTKDWIIRNRQRLLWLPPDYRAHCGGFYNNIFVLGHYSGRVTFIGFDFSVTQI